LGLFPCGQCG